MSDRAKTVLAWLALAFLAVVFANQTLALLEKLGAG